MQAVSLVLICVVCVYHAAAQNPHGHKQKREAEALASLLATHSPPAAISTIYTHSTPTVTAEYTGRRGSRDGRDTFYGGRRGRSRALRFEVNGVDVEVPVKFEGSKYGGKLTTGFNFTAGGLRWAFPFTFLLREFMNIRIDEPFGPFLRGPFRGFRFGRWGRRDRYDDYDDLDEPRFGRGRRNFFRRRQYDDYDEPYMRMPFRPGRWFADNIKEFSVELERPLEWEQDGYPFKVPVRYEAGDLKYPVEFNISRWKFAIPMRYSLSGGFTVPTMELFDTQVPKVTAQLKRSYIFDVPWLRYQTFEVPVKFDGERLTTALETRQRVFGVPVKFQLPLSFLLRGLTRLNERKISRWVRRNLSPDNVKAELERPVTLGKRKDAQLTIPVNVQEGQIAFPFNFTTKGWNISFPATWKFTGNPWRRDVRTLADFNARDIYGKVGWLGAFQGQVVLIAEISTVEECAELHDLQKMNRLEDLQVIAAVSDPRVIDEIRAFEKFSYHRTGSVVKGEFYPSGMVILDDSDSELFEWLRDQKRGLGFNFGNDKFLLNRAGRPVARFGPLSLRSYEDAVEDLL